MAQQANAYLRVLLRRYRVDVRALVTSATRLARRNTLYLCLVAHVTGARPVAGFTRCALQPGRSRLIHKATLAISRRMAGQALGALFLAHVNEQFEALGVG